MNEQQPQDLGKQISQIVQNALNSKDFTELKSTIDATVREVKQGVADVRQSINTYPPHTKAPRQGYTPPPKTVYTTPAGAPQRPPQARPAQQRPARPNYNYTYSYTSPVTKKKLKLPGRTASILWRTFGMIGAIPMGIGAVMGTIIFLTGGGIPLAVVGTFAALFGITFGMTIGGFQISKRLKRFERYLQITKGAHYYDLKQLAAATAQSKRSLVKDIKQMMRHGLFAEAYLDADESTLILDQTTYKQYQLAEAAKHQKKLEATMPKPAADSPAGQMLTEGRAYIRQIKEANDAIPDINVSDKLYRLSEITAKIFAYVETHPEKQADIRKFMTYYLPTTLKLVNAYRDFDRQTTGGENITRAKGEIVEVLDTINNAFQTLLESLYDDDVLDISTDISALGTILRQDGLTDDGIGSKLS